MKKKHFSMDDTWEGSSESISYKPGKGVFITLMGISALGVILAGFLFWYIPTVGLKNINPTLPYILGVLVLVLCIFVLGGVFVISLAIIRGRDVFHSSRFRWLLVRLFLPIMVMIGGILRIPRIKIERAFIEINNQMVRFMGKRYRPERILILMPHCIQFEDCKIKVTKDVRNCVGCGKCEIADLISISDQYGINLFVSTGGTIARRKLYEYRPDAVIAVACERDLTSGVQDAYPLPVLAIVNKRPRGYCVGTGVDINAVKKAIDDLVAQGSA